MSISRLPQLTLDKSWLMEGWKKTSLGACSLTAKELEPGRRGDPSDAALKALLVAPETLVLELRDNHWTGPSNTWLADDHLEIWLDAVPPEDVNVCHPLSANEQPVAWAIRVADGQVFPMHGSPQGSLRVERVEVREAGERVGYRFKVGLPQDFKGISVLYRDSDPGQQQERLLGTSDWKSARPETFNGVWQVAPTEATCAMRQGALVVVPTPIKPKGRDFAILGPFEF